MKPGKLQRNKTNHSASPPPKKTPKQTNKNKTHVMKYNLYIYRV